MKELNGLWKDKHCGLLVQLHGAAMRTQKADADLAGMATLKAVARVVKGDEDLMDTKIRLTAVLPKQPVTIHIIDASQRGPTMWDVEGIVISSKDNVFTEGRAG